MPDSKSTEAERRRKSKFTFLPPLLLIALPVSVLAVDDLVLPVLDPLPRPHSAEVRFEPVRLSPRLAPPLRLAGAWQLTSADRDLAGISALALDRDSLVAVTDSGMVARLPTPGTGTAASIRRLPSGPGDPHYKAARDSEALARDPRGRGWWVAFERRDELWLYDPAFERALRRLRIRRSGWGENSGIEGLVASRRGLLLVPEHAETLVRLGDGKARRLPLHGRHGRISDAALLPSGRLLAIERKFSWRGFRSALLVIRDDGASLAIERRIPLRLAPLDNPEALAVEHLPDGRLRLWIASDDNGERPLRTLLVALDVPSGALGGT